MTAQSPTPDQLLELQAVVARGLHLTDDEHQQWAEPQWSLALAAIGAVRPWLRGQVNPDGRDGVALGGALALTFQGEAGRATRHIQLTVGPATRDVASLVDAIDAELPGQGWELYRLDSMPGLQPLPESHRRSAVWAVKLPVSRDGHKPATPEWAFLDISREPRRHDPVFVPERGGRRSGSVLPVLHPDDAAAALGRDQVDRRDDSASGAAQSAAVPWAAPQSRRGAALRRELLRAASRQTTSRARLRVAAGGHARSGR